MTYSNMDISTEITELVAQVAEATPATVEGCRVIADLPNWDSLKQIMLLAAIERSLAVRLPLDAFLGARELGEITALVGKARRS